MRFVAVLLCLIPNIQGQDVDVRLNGTGYTASQGRVEVYYNNTWGTICNDEFDLNDAAVICRMLGYSHGGSVVPVQRFGPGTGKIWMDNLDCGGLERRIEHCPFNGWGNVNCNDSEDVGVICDSPTQAPPSNNCSGNTSSPQQGDVRLIGPNNQTGFVQVYYNNTWGAVCDDLWDIQDAKVVCNMLCLSTANAHTGTPSLLNNFRLNMSSTYVLDDVECFGSENTISACRHRPWGVTDCTGRTEYATVACNVDTSRQGAPDPNVTCDNGEITATFSRQRDPYLLPNHLNVDTTVIPCGARKHDTTDIISISIPFEECGTNVTTNATHIIYINAILYDYTNNTGNLVRINTYHIELWCIFPRNSTHYRGMVPLTEEIKRKATGEFRVTMDFYNDTSFMTAYGNYLVNITLGQWLNVALTLHEYNTNLKLVVPDCIATPTTSDTYSINHPLFVNKCQQESTVGFFPLNTTTYGFRYKTFKFVNFGEIYIHCKAIVCHVNEKDAQCDRSCNQTVVGRKRRSVSSKFIYYISSPPIKFISKNEENAIIREWDVPGNTHTSTSMLLSSKLLTTPRPTSQSTKEKSLPKISSHQTISTLTSPKFGTFSVSTMKSTPRPTTSSQYSFSNTSVSMSARTSTSVTSMSSKLQPFPRSSTDVPEVTSEEVLASTSQTRHYTTSTYIYPIHVRQTTKRSINIKTQKLVKEGETINRDVPLLVALRDIRISNSCPEMCPSYYVSLLMFFVVFPFLC